MRKGIILAFGALALLAGCGSAADKPANVPVTPKWKGAPYRISFDKPPAKPNPSGITIPDIKYTANPDALERRATLVLRFDPSAVKTDKEVINQMIIAPVDIPGTDGALPGDYMDVVNKDMSGLIGAYCVKGKVKVSVAFARSSLTTTADESEIEQKRLSDWAPIDLDFKHPKC
ncbi:MAG TPA: hypothetical protein VKB38_08405 [Terracidiphilus sp.]|nr:hypothetical protein [Terracidiphilus sp.]